MSICYKATIVKALSRMILLWGLSDWILNALSRMTLLWGLADGILPKECPLLLPLLFLFVVLVGLGTFLCEAPPRKPFWNLYGPNPFRTDHTLHRYLPHPPRCRLFHLSTHFQSFSRIHPSCPLLNPLLVSPGNGHRSPGLVLVRMDEDCKDKWVLPFMYFYLSTALSSFPTTLLNLIILMYPPIRAVVLKP